MSKKLTVPLLSAILLALPAGPAWGGPLTMLQEMMCDAGSADMCRARAAGTDFMQEPSRLPEATIYLEKACQLDESEACEHLGVAGIFHLTNTTGLVSFEGDKAEGCRMLDIACTVGNHHLSCISLADELERGNHIEQDVERANALRKRLCSEGYETACEPVPAERPADEDVPEPSAADE